MYDEYTLIKIVENKFKGVVYPALGKTNESPTGEPYWEVDSEAHTKDSEIKEMFSTPSEAVNKFKLCVLKIISALSSYGDGGEVLYWREFPKLERKKNKFRVYSRFLISSKERK